MNKAIHPDIQRIMKKVSNILTRKGSSVVAIDGSTTVLDALRLMSDKNIGSVVITEGGEYAGLLTERDYARKVILQGKSSLETQVREIMSTGLPRVLPDNSVETCMHIMSESNLRYLPVFQADNLCGIISISDVVTETILSHEETIEHLKSYIQS
ncbi:MAG: histidine kinase [Mucilaginibacter sp.]|nr:histidine kinase [Mucilaginibacter sp.]